MPKRLSIRTFDTKDLQGDGSFVKIRSINYGYAKKMREEIKSAQERDDNDLVEAIGAKMIVDHIVEWNWCDDDGKPLPAPDGNPAILDSLTEGEVRFLGEHLNDTDEHRKKSTTS